MRRRSPPSSLRLFQGPLPPRSQPKHTLPSLPCPAFHPEAFLPRDPAPIPRTRHHAPRLHFDTINIPISPELRPLNFNMDSPTSSPVSATKRVRGPWDDSASVVVVVDVDSILAWPKPVAIGV